MNLASLIFENFKYLGLNKGPADWVLLLVPKMTSPIGGFGELGLAVLVHQLAKENSRNLP